MEYEALNEDWGSRGKRCEEQIEVLRLLWTEEVVDYKGQWHRIDHAGIKPRPVQRPIPIWIGAGAPARPMPPRHSHAPHRSNGRRLVPAVSPE